MSNISQMSQCAIWRTKNQQFKKRIAGSVISNESEENSELSRVLIKERIELTGENC